MVFLNSASTTALANCQRIHRFSVVRSLKRNGYQVHQRRVCRKGFSRYNFRTEAEQEDDIPTLQVAIDQFNEGEYYAAHDSFEALWHVSVDPQRTALQGILQTAVGLYHMLNGNLRGSMLEIGEGLRRMKRLDLSNAQGLEQFLNDTEAVLDFMYATHLEDAACNETECISMHEGNPEQYERLDDLSNQQRINLNMYKVISGESGTKTIVYVNSPAKEECSVRVPRLELRDNEFDNL